MKTTSKSTVSRRDRIRLREIVRNLARDPSRAGQTPEELAAWAVVHFVADYGGRVRSA